MDTSGNSFRLKCLRCGFMSPNDDKWNQSNHPALGTIPKCPDCGSTDTTYLSNISPEDE